MSKIERKKLSQKLISQRYVFTLSQTYFASISLAGLVSEPQTFGATKDQEIPEEFFSCLQILKNSKNTREFCYKFLPSPLKIG